MTTSTMAEFLSRTGIYRIDGLNVKIIVNDCRERFGNLDFLIEPISGDGSKWVAETSVELFPSE